MQRDVNKQVMGQICQNGFSSDASVSRFIRWDSGSDLNLSDLDIGGNGSASESDVEGGNIPAPAEAEPALPSTSNGL